jgi:hypothetical protein
MWKLVRNGQPRFSITYRPTPPMATKLSQLSDSISRRAPVSISLQISFPVSPVPVNQFELWTRHYYEAKNEADR